MDLVRNNDLLMIGGIVTLLLRSCVLESVLILIKDEVCNHKTHFGLRSSKNGMCWLQPGQGCSSGVFDLGVH